MTTTRTPQTVSISIGRNIGETPMSDLDWSTFKALTLSTTKLGGVPILTKADGKGFWLGQEEDTFVIIAQVPSKVSADYLGSLLAQIARRYGQDGIGFVVAPSEASVLS